MSISALQLKITDTPFDPDSNDKIIHTRVSTSGKKLYKVWISLEGQDLVFVRQVKYILHPTFGQREHTLERSFTNPKFRMFIYTWGIFEVKAIVEARRGSYELRHTLEYDRKFAEATRMVAE